MTGEVQGYIAEKVQEVKEKGLVDVETVVSLGHGVEEIITLARNTPDNFIAMLHPWPVGFWAMGLGKRH